MVPLDSLRIMAKNGAPMKAVITPIGNSAGATITLAKVSAEDKNAPPTIAESGIIIL